MKIIMKNVHIYLRSMSIALIFASSNYQSIDFPQKENRLVRKDK